LPKGGTIASTEREPVTEVWGQSPQHGLQWLNSYSVYVPTIIKVGRQ